MKQKLINAHMATARNYAELSQAIRLHVGAIVSRMIELYPLATMACQQDGITTAKK